jgi:hypothetical protein
MFPTAFIRATTRAMIRAPTTTRGMRTTHRRIRRPPMIHRCEITAIVTRRLMMGVLLRRRPTVMLTHRRPFRRIRPRVQSPGAAIEAGVYIIHDYRLVIGMEPSADVRHR